jgi:hypothetical protein
MTSSTRAAPCPGTCHAASTHPNPLPKMSRQRETCPRRQTRQTSHNVTPQLSRSVSPMCPGAVPAACPRGPDEAPARRRSTYNPRIMAGLARQMASARCSLRGASCRVITVTAGFFWDLVCCQSGTSVCRDIQADRGCGSLAPQWLPSKTAAVRRPPLTCTYSVELRGFEPLTPSMRTRCATGLRYSPKELPLA